MKKAVEQVANNSTLEMINFASAGVPIPYEPLQRNTNNFVWYGTNNYYPSFLLKLYNGSPSHSSIINSKASYIVGKGLRYTDDLETPLEIKVNSHDNFIEFINKVVKDYLIFQAFAVEVVYNSFRKPIEYHFVPVQNVRTNIDKSKFWISEDWENNFKPVILDRWKEKPDNTKSVLFYYDGYNPSKNKTYPCPEYSGAMTSILTDMKIRDFNLNNITNHFSVSTLITFFRGSNIDADTKKAIIKDLKSTYAGENGSKMIVDFQDPNQPAAKVENIAPNDWDKAYNLIANSTKQDILQAHQITSPSLFGVATAGKLGGSNEMELAYEIFQNTYARNKRNEISSALNQLLFDSELFEKGKIFVFAEAQLFEKRISDAIKEKVFTINEIRAEVGLPPLKDGDKLISNPSKVSEQKMSSDNENGATEEDFYRVEHLGFSSDDYEIEEDNPENFAAIEEDKETFYKYQVRQNHGRTLKKTSRAFCRMMVNLNKLYNQEDIDEMTEILGYDIFSLGGGWYHNPSTGENTSHCRHQFKEVTVKKKK